MTSTAKKEPKRISLKEASRILGVHPETMRRWDNRGELKAIRKGSRGDRFYYLSDIVKILEER